MLLTRFKNGRPKSIGARIVLTALVSLAGAMIGVGILIWTGLAKDMDIGVAVAIGIGAAAGGVTAEISRLKRTRLAGEADPADPPSQSEPAS
jgi:drug/metabolite transporter (DMT)-like permease